MKYKGIELRQGLVSDDKEDTIMLICAKDDIRGYADEHKIKLTDDQMNKKLGTTIVLTASNDQNLKTIASVLIYLDNGHVSKVRTGLNKRSGRRSEPRKFNRTKKRPIR